MKYKELVDVYKALESTTRRLEKTDIITKLLKKCSVDDIRVIMLLLQGRIFPAWEEKKLGVASRLVLKAINVASGISVSKIEDEWKKSGDLGLAAEKFISGKKQATLFSTSLNVKKVFENLVKLASMEGKGAVDQKVKLIAELLTSASPLEARYIVRTVLEDLRVGVGEGSVRDAIVWAFLFPVKYNKEENDISLSAEDREKYNSVVEAVQEAYDVKNDFSEVALIAKKSGVKGLEKVGLGVGKPIKVMLYQKAKDMEDAFDIVGKPAALEYKYDGFRMQLHRDKDEIKLFTRRLDNVTRQFPDVVKILKDHVKSKNYILDAEIIGIDPKTKAWLPFQAISQRIKRKYDIDRMVKEVPVMVNIFDAIQVDHNNIIKEPFSERRKALKKIVDEIKEKLQLAKQVVTGNVKEAQKFYDEALSKGNEGIMVKALDKPYKPGSRVGYGVKVKPVMETLDLVIVGADWGEGKRAHWLSSFTVACRKGDSLLEIGKVGTGIKEKEEEGVSFLQLTKMLKPLIKSEKGKSIEVKPKVVIEINYEEIQKSPTYSSGYALRFPRLVRLRIDKPVSEASSLKMVEKLYNEQRGR